MDTVHTVIVHTSRLPVELEREIFELASWSDYRTAYSLIHVAKRVHQWIEPLLYRVICLEHGEQHPSSLIERFEAIEDRDSSDFKNLERQSKYVHHYIHMASNYAFDSLSLCTSIVDLALWSTPQRFDTPALVTIMSDLHLRRLSIAGDIFERHPQMLAIFENTALIESLTHLDLFEVGHFWLERWKIIKNCRHLTHIAIEGYFLRAAGTMKSLLDTMPELLLLVDLDGDGSQQHHLRVIDYPRFIAFTYPGGNMPVKFPELWFEGTWRGTGRDFWALAEDLQCKKRDRLSQAQQQA